MRRVLLVFLALALAPCARAEVPEAHGTIDLTGARVLASPGAPEGLAAKPLTWPLPSGPLLVLGLPRTDTAALDLALFWDLLGPGEDLHGGYLVAAWHDGERSLVVVLADDVVALRAARGALAGAAVPPGVRHVRPVFRRRAYYPRASRLDAAAVSTAVAGRANRFWIHASHDLAAFDPLPRLAQHGIAPCVVLFAGAGKESESAARAKPWIDRGVCDLVLIPAGSDIEADDVLRHVERLRSAFELDEIVVVHPTIRVPGTVGTWLPWPDSAGGTLAERSRHAVASSRVPLLFVDGWARSNRTPVPSRPRGRTPELGRLFDGAVVGDGFGAREVLEASWAPCAARRDAWESVLLPLLPRTPMPPRVFLQQVLRRLEAVDSVDWIVPLRERIRSSISELAERVVLVPRAPTPVRVDGLVDEAAWAYASALAFPIPGDEAHRSGSLLAVSDGRVLHVALRLPAEVAPLPLTLSTSAIRPDLRRALGDDAIGRVRQSGETWTWEGTLGHFELAGDAHPTRVFHLWHRPTKGEPKRLGSLVLGP